MTGRIPRLGTEPITSTLMSGRIPRLGTVSQPTLVFMDNNDHSQVGVSPLMTDHIPRLGTEPMNHP